MGKTLRFNDRLTDPHNASVAPWRVVISAGLATSLSLLGDSALYTVLPTHVAEVGVPLASVGILLSANRFIRLFLNGPMGLAYDRWPRRYLFVLALFIGAISTAIYALTQGFWLLLVGRLLWGLAWAGIWVGGNAIILDVTQEDNRGRWIGIYQVSFFLGASSGAVAGGLLTDWLGYHRAMGLAAGLSVLGAITALIFLPETGRSRHIQVSPAKAVLPSPNSTKPIESPQFVSALALLGVNRLLIAGILISTFGLFLFEQIGESTQIAGQQLGVATLTGIALGTQSIISMVAAPVMGRLSDRLKNRWQAVAGGLGPGVAGFGILAVGSPLGILAGIPLMAVSAGSNQSLSTALVGDLSSERQRGRRLGLLFTVGDLTSAIGPPLVYGIMPLFGLSLIYLISGGLYAVMLVIAMWWAVRN